MRRQLQILGWVDKKDELFSEEKKKVLQENEDFFLLFMSHGSQKGTELKK